MDWQDTLHALRSFLNECRHEKNDLILDLVSFVLRNNFFLYHEVVYHQLSGMAMGTPMAVNVANIFLYLHEKTTISTFKLSIMFFGRFVDDLLLAIPLSRISYLPEIKQHL